MGKRELTKFQYGDYLVLMETELLPNGNKKCTARQLKGKLTDRYDDIRIKYCLAADKLLDKKEFFEVIVGDRFDQKDYVMAVYRGFYQQRHCSTLEELLYYAKWAEHFVPNTFYKWESRSKENLRVLSWMFFDFELRKSNGQAFTPLQVWEIFRQETGFTPTIIKQSNTPGSYHVGLHHTTLNGSTESIYLFDRIQARIAKKIGTDAGAVGANHLFSIPKKGQKIFYFQQEIIDFNELKHWWLAELQKENADKIKKMNKKTVTSLTEYKVWNHPAVKALEENEYDGSRNEAGFTLALLFYALGKTEEEAKDFLLNHWYPHVDQRGKPYRLSELKATLKSAFSGKYAGPSKEKIEALTGIAFNLRIYRGQYQRSVRHNITDNQQAIIAYLRNYNGTVEMTQKQLIEAICQTQKSPLGKPFSFDSIKRNLRKLKDQGIVSWESKGSGGNIKNKATKFILNDGVQRNFEVVIEEDNNVYVLGKAMNLN